MGPNVKVRSPPSKGALGAGIKNVVVTKKYSTRKPTSSLQLLKKLCQLTFISTVGLNSSSVYYSGKQYIGRTIHNLDCWINKHRNNIKKGFLLHSVLCQIHEFNHILHSSNQYPHLRPPFHPLLVLPESIRVSFPTPSSPSPFPFIVVYLQY